jgi:hypothetical protein
MKLAWCTMVKCRAGSMAPIFFLYTCRYKNDENSDEACMVHDGEVQSWESGCWKVSDPQRRSLLPIY